MKNQPGQELKDLPEYRMHRIFIEVKMVPAEYFEQLPKLETVAHRNLDFRFFLVHPSALQHIDLIRKSIQDTNLEIASELLLSNFETLARYLYPVRPEKKKSYLWLYANRQLFPANFNTCYVFKLLHKYETSKLMILKKKIRKQIGVLPLRMLLNSGRHEDLYLHHIHCPKDIELTSHNSVIHLFLLQHPS